MKKYLWLPGKGLIASDSFPDECGNDRPLSSGMVRCAELSQSRFTPGGTP